MCHLIFLSKFGRLKSSLTSFFFFLPVSEPHHVLISLVILLGTVWFLLTMFVKYLSLFFIVFSHLYQFTLFLSFAFNLFYQLVFFNCFSSLFYLLGLLVTLLFPSCPLLSPRFANGRCSEYGGTLSPKYNWKYTKLLLFLLPHHADVHFSTTRKRSGLHLESWKALGWT